LRAAQAKKKKRKISKTLSQRTSWVWWHIPVPVVSANWEAEVGGRLLQASSGKGTRPYLKTELKQKGLGVWLKWSSACAASSNPSTARTTRTEMTRKGTVAGKASHSSVFYLTRYFSPPVQ
jgi:hypothetical protein